MKNETQAQQQERRRREWQRYGIGGSVKRFILDDGSFQRAMREYYAKKDAANKAA